MSNANGGAAAVVVYYERPILKNEKYYKR